MANASGKAIAVTGVGVLLMYSGITNAGIFTSISSLIRGKQPAQGANTVVVGSSASSTGSVQGASAITNPENTSAQTALKNAAAAYGWDSGAQWDALVAIENQEASFNPTNTNPSSGAYGLAQSLGHHFSGGPAADGVNEYGGEGLSAAQSYQASMGDPNTQAIWMVNYIAQTYGTPVVAEQFHLANNWY